MSERYGVGGLLISPAVSLSSSGAVVLRMPPARSRQEGGGRRHSEGLKGKESASFYKRTDPSDATSSTCLLMYMDSVFSVTAPMQRATRRERRAASPRRREVSMTNAQRHKPSRGASLPRNLRVKPRRQKCRPFELRVLPRLGLEIFGAATAAERVSDRGIVIKSSAKTPHKARQIRGAMSISSRAAPSI